MRPSIGGIGTPIGTPPNLFFRSVYEQSTGTAVTFSEWMTWGIPVVIIFIPAVWFWLKRGLSTKNQLDVPHPGKWRQEEIRVLIVFAITALLWITRKEPFGGWSSWLDLPGARDSSVALLAAAIMFVIPNGKQGRLLDWETANKIPWGVLILFGGGITIAKAFEQSGLSEILGNQLTILTDWPILIVVPLICLAVTFITEVTSNTATTTLLMPILAAAGTVAGIDPAILMVPAAMSASCAFMLPVATAPNAVVFGSEKTHGATNGAKRVCSEFDRCGYYFLSLPVYFKLAAIAPGIWDSSLEVRLEPRGQRFRGRRFRGKQFSELKSPLEYFPAG